MYKFLNNLSSNSRNWKTNGSHADIVAMKKFIMEGYKMLVNGCSISDATSFTSLLMGQAGFSNEEVSAYCNSCHLSLYEGVRLGETKAQIQERVKDVALQSLAYLVKCCERFNSGDALVPRHGVYLEKNEQR